MDAPEEQLKRLRASIDELDAALISLLAERFRVTDQVGALKARHQLPAVDAAREAAQAERIRRLAEEAGMDPAAAERILRAVITEVVARHVAAGSRA